MREIKPLYPEHIDAYTDIAYRSYPSFKDFGEEPVRAYKAKLKQVMETHSDTHVFGMFEDEKLIAVMRLFDFSMNCFGKVVKASGLGFLGVHLMHKKQKVARAMVDFYEDYYRQQGVAIGSLLPFNPEFYRPMGYGIGTKVNQYRVATVKIPAHKGGDVRYVERGEYGELLACHERVVAKTHGMISKICDEKRDLSDPFNQIVGAYDANGKLTGYILFKFLNGKPGNFTINNIYVQEIIYETPETLKVLLGFLRRQEDQVQRVIFNTCDEHFHYLFDNPLNDTNNYVPYGCIESNTQNCGIMYKLLDIRKAFSDCAHRNYNGMDLAVRFAIIDDYTGKLREHIAVAFENGGASLDAALYDMTVTIRLSDFSCLFMGCASVLGLYGVGRLETDREDWLRQLDTAFYCGQKPMCNTDF